MLSTILNPKMFKASCEPRTKCPPPPAWRWQSQPRGNMKVAPQKEGILLHPSLILKNYGVIIIVFWPDRKTWKNDLDVQWSQHSPSSVTGVAELKESPPTPDSRTDHQWRAVSWGGVVFNSPLKGKTNNTIISLKPIDDWNCFKQIGRSYVF